MRVLLVAALAFVVVPPPDRPGAPTLPADVPGMGLAAVAARGAGEGAAVCSVQTLREQAGPYTAAQIREMVENAHVIVRAVAVDSARAEVPELPPGQFLRPSYEHRIDFRTTEVLRGPWPDSVFTLPGEVGDRDDFNTKAVPYGMVRPAGQRGNCFATEYRIGGEYLLLLRPAAPDSPVRDYFSMTVWWMPLGPTNEQIRGADDPWVRWVRDQLSAP